MAHGHAAFLSTADVSVPAGLGMGSHVVSVYMGVRLGVGNQCEGALQAARRAMGSQCGGILLATAAGCSRLMWRHLGDYGCGTVKHFAVCRGKSNVAAARSVGERGGLLSI